MPLALALFLPGCAGTVKREIHPENKTDEALIIETAERGDAEAQYKVGLMYDNGKGVPQNYFPQRYVEAAKWYRKAADQGNANAQSKLGLMYANGVGVLKDEAESAKWYRQAADQGNADAQNSLGIMYYFGKGVPEDFAESAKWYRMAADQGDANAQNNLGGMYARGQGVPKDFIQAYLLLTLAGAQGYFDTTQFREAVAAKMTSAQIAEAKRLISEWRSKSAK